MKACPDIEVDESALLQTLVSIGSYKITDGTLSLQSEDENTVALFESFDF